MATEELATLAVMNFTAINQVLVQYRPSSKSEDEILLINVPEKSIPIQGITVAGKLDEEVVTEVTQVVTTAIEMKHNLSEVDQNKWEEWYILMAPLALQLMSYWFQVDQVLRSFIPSHQLLRWSFCIPFVFTLFTN